MLQTNIVTNRAAIQLKMLDMRAKLSDTVSLGSNKYINTLTDQLRDYEIHRAAFAAKNVNQFTFLMLQL